MTAETDKLANVLKDQLPRFNKSVGEAADFFSGQLTAGDKVVGVVLEHGHALQKAVMEIQAALGSISNFPPTDAEPEA